MKRKQQEEIGNLHGSSGILQSLHPLLADDEDEGHLAMAQLTDVGEKLLPYRLRANEEAEILPLSYRYLLAQAMDAVGGGEEGVGTDEGITAGLHASRPVLQGVTDSVAIYQESAVYRQAKTDLTLYSDFHPSPPFSDSLRPSPIPDAAPARHPIHPCFSPSASLAAPWH